MSRLIAMATTILLVTGCATTPPIQTSAVVQVVGATELPSPNGRTGDELELYRIGALDLVVLDVYGFAALTTREIQVNESGRISVPLAGQIDIAGLTPMEAEVAIAQRMREAHVRNPQVSLNLKESRNRVVTVDGQVNRPGNFPVLANMTLMRAVAGAGGAGEFAKLEDVVVFRTVNGQRMAALFNLAAIRRGAYADPKVYPMDIIVVGNSSSRRLFRDILLTAPLLAVPLIAVLRR